MSDYVLHVMFKSNERPWRGTHTPASWHQPNDDDAAIKWATEMQAALGDTYQCTLTRDGEVLPLPSPPSADHTDNRSG